MYRRSVLLRYIEEAAAETYAQIRVNGMSGLMDGLTFPLRIPEYGITLVSLGQAAQGVAIGTITVGGTMYTVYIITYRFEKINQPIMTEQEAIERARQIALEEGWTWREPVEVFTHRTGLFFGPKYWAVRSNARMRGCNVEVCFDPKTGKILGKGFLPR